MIHHANDPEAECRYTLPMGAAAFIYARFNIEISRGVQIHGKVSRTVCKTILFLI
jgi:hypothetical protein